MRHPSRNSIVVGGLALGLVLAAALASQTPRSSAHLSAQAPIDKTPDGARATPANYSPADPRRSMPEGDPSDALRRPAPAIAAPYLAPFAQQVQELKDEVRTVQQQQSATERSFLEYALETIKNQNARLDKSTDGRADQPAGTDAGKTDAGKTDAGKTDAGKTDAGKTSAGDDAGLAADPTSPREAAAPSTAAEPVPAPTAATASPTRRPALDIHHAEGDDSLELNLRDSDLRQVLDLLSEQTGLNILASSSVTGSVTATLRGVDGRSALQAILKSSGYVSRVEGNFIYVGTPEDLQAMDTARDKVLTRIYYPNYVKAAELQTLIAPLLSSGVGKISVCTPAEVGIPADNTQTGGDAFAGGEVLLVKDYEAVLWQVDQIVLDVDKRPRQVSIEAMILSVRLSDTLKAGVDFQALRNQANLRLYSNSPMASLATIDTTNGGLKIGFLDSGVAAFIDALETIGDTNVIASPRLLCLNKQKAEILIGSKLGYVSTTVTQTAATQTVNFLEVGTALRIRPFIYTDGTIRMEVHPELSTGNVRIAGALTLPDKDVTEVTTNIMCQDGATVVIGGLIREELDTNGSQLPLLGNLPWVGALFRHRTQTTDRRELIVLITPRVTNDAALACEGDKITGDSLNRQRLYADKMSPIGKRYYGERYLRYATAAWNAHDATTAFRYVNLALHFDPLSPAANDLRNAIVAANPEFDASIRDRLKTGLTPKTRPKQDYSQDGFSWRTPYGGGPAPSGVGPAEPGPSGVGGADSGPADSGPAGSGPAGSGPAGSGPAGPVRVEDPSVPGTNRTLELLP